ncbi:MAG TPA: type IV secretion system DNA-binding domain-containing protein [Acidimicrobiales bacterium]|nr:type IV secretion system DNA-binding domain-containing protein [Acidimicrobiales bacterium]
MTLAWLVLSVFAFGVAVVVRRAAEAAHRRRSLIAFTLRFPRQTPAEAVEAVLAGWSGTLPPWWRRFFTGSPFLMSEVCADHSGITHRLLVPGAWEQLLVSLLHAHLPSVRYERTEAVAPAAGIGAEYRLSTSQRPLTVDAAVLSARLLSSLQPLRDGEVITVQYVLASAPPVAPARVEGKSEGATWLTTDNGVVTTSEAATALRKKHSAALLLAVGRIGVVAHDQRRARLLLRHVEAAWHGVRAPGVLLRRRVLPPGLVGSRIQQRRVPLVTWPGGVLNVTEASGLVGWPIELDAVPGLELGGCRLLPVPGGVPSRGAVVGIGTFPGTQRPVALDARARTHHTLVIGPTGVGKSVLLGNLALAGLAENRQAVVVIDPKDGELVDNVLEQLPDHRLDDVIVFDPTDARPVGFDPLRSTPATRELVVDRVVSIMASIWHSAWGPRSSDLIRHTLLTLTQVPGMTLCEAPALLSADPGFRRRVLAQVDDPVGVAPFWAWFNSLSAAEVANITAAPLNKLRAFTTRTAVRHTLGQPNPAVDFDRLLADGGVLLVRLPIGLLGEETAGLLGALVTAQLWQAVSARAAVPTTERHPALVVIDELQSVLRLPVNAVEDMLAMARGYGVGAVLAAQAMYQLGTDLRHAALANTRSKVVFGCDREDAALFAREFGSGLTPDDLMNLDAYEAVVTAFANGRTQPPSTVRTLPPGEPLRAASVVKEHSRARFGADRADIEAAIRARLHIGRDDGSIGRSRRSM